MRGELSNILIKQLETLTKSAELGLELRKCFYASAVTGLGKWNTGEPDSDRMVVAYDRKGEKPENCIFLARFKNGRWRDEETGEVYNTAVDMWMEIPEYEFKQ